MSRNVAPVIAAEALLHHGLSDDAIVGYIARTWPLDEHDCRAAVLAAHILLRRERADSIPPTTLTNTPPLPFS
jgi:hypothetical protein